MHKKKRPDIPLLLFYIGVVFLIFLAGGFFGERNLAPYRWLDEGVDAYRALSKQFQLERPEKLLPIKYAGLGVTRHNMNRTWPGTTLIQGIFPEGVVVQLIDMDGSALRTWPLKPYEIWPGLEHLPPHLRPASDFNYSTQGMLALPDGSIVVNFAKIGIVKFDKCGRTIWKLALRTHHSVTQDSDGSFWVPLKVLFPEIPEERLLPWISRSRFLKNGKGNVYEDRLLHISSDGEVLKEIPILESLLDGSFEHLLVNSSYQKKLDPTHINDIDIVTPALANKLPEINQGDLLVSVRNMHMLVIVDRDTGQIKWHHAGPWVHQHSPVILPDGNILVFNNGYETTEFSRDRVPGSNLIELDPSTRQTRITYPTEESQSFYARIMGHVQSLPNGNRLITESKAGRVFEIDKTNQTVWEFVKPYDDEYTSVVTVAIRYGSDFFEVDDWSCESP